MTLTNLFEQHLLKTAAEAAEARQVTESNELIADAITGFAQSLETVEDWTDLGESWALWCELNELSEDAIEVLQNTMIEASEQAYGGAEDHQIKSLLKILAQPFPKAGSTTPNKEGMTPEAGETSTRGFLKQLKVAAHPDPYGNDYLGGVKAYDREANRHGYNYSYKNDFNNQRPTWPLANPSLNVNTGATDESRVFEAIDAVGIGAKVHYRVVNKLTGEYVTRNMHQEQAEEIAADLNRKTQDLHEGVSRKHFEQVAATVKAIEDPQRRQHFADHHAGIFAQQNPRFDLARWHAACNTQDINKGKVQRNEAMASLPLQESSYLRPLDPRSIEAFNKFNAQPNYTASGNVTDSDHTVNHAAEWRATQNLLNEKKARFERNRVSESDAVRSKQRVKRIVGMNEFEAESHAEKQAFLNGINTRGLIK
jgi:hypothetical protein